MSLKVVDLPAPFPTSDSCFPVLGHSLFTPPPTPLLPQGSSNVYSLCLGGLVVEHLPSAQGVILKTRDGVRHRAPCTGPASPSAGVSASLSVSLTNK